jgi:hypothetical protein
VSIESPETKLQRVSVSAAVVVFKSWRKSAPPSASALESRKPCKPREQRGQEAATTLQVRKEEEDKATAGPAFSCMLIV